MARSRCVAVRLVACIAIVGAASTAYADREPVRDDIVELRHGRRPTPLRFLGWTADGRAVLHEARYGFQDASCAPEGSSMLVVVRGDGTSESTAVLAPEVDDNVPLCSDAWPWRVSTEAASRAIRTEAVALDALGPLEPGTSPAGTELLLVRGDCWLHLATGQVGHRKTIARVSTIGPKACIANGHDLSIHEAQIVDIHASPDGRALAVTVDVTTLSLDSYSSFMDTVVVSAPTN